MIWYLISCIAGTTICLTQTYAPTNIIAGFIRTRRGHKWGLPIAAVLVPADAIAFRRVAATATATDNGWLYLLALLMFWNAGKLFALGILGAALLVRASAREWTWAGSHHRTASTPCLSASLLGDRDRQHSSERGLAVRRNLGSTSATRRSR